MSAGWFVLVYGQGHARPHALVAGAPMTLEAGAARVRIWLVAAGGDVLVVERLERVDSSRPPMLNDVQLTVGTSVRPGDLLTVDGESALVMRSRDDDEVAQGGRVLGRTEIERLGELVVARAQRFGGPARVALVWARRGVLGASLVRELGERASALGYVVGALGESALELVGFTDLGSLERLLVEWRTSRLEALRWAEAVYPEDGDEVHRLREVCVDRLLDGEVGAQQGDAPMEGEPVIVETAIVRLMVAVEGLLLTGRSVLLEGAPGCGKAVLARALAARVAAAGKEAPRVVPRAERLPLWEQLELSRGGHGAPFIATVRSGALSSLHPALAEHVSDSRALVPGLMDRPAEIVPLAVRFASLARRRLSRQRLSLAADAREQLSGMRLRGGVRGLRNAIHRAALAAEVEELELSALVDEGALGAAPDLRSSLREAEAEVLREALRETGWNVTEVARRLKLPRRTIVYRMARLGLKRPR